ncbi:response regulator [Desulfovibrio sp. OttesenSCG-928-C14]|nr:response regulator [Desulfovibrio sp. OttesenSCG-928-C14]
MLLLTALLFSIFHFSMPGVLLQIETTHLSEHRELIKSLFAAAQKRTYQITEDTAIWDETVTYVEGDNPGYFKDNWPETSLPERFECNFVILKDAQGHDLHLEFHDYINNRAMPAPAGFSARLAPLAKQVSDRYPEVRKEEKIGIEGILFHEGVPYYIAISPIIPSRKANTPSGVLIMGNILSNTYFQDTTNFKTFDFLVTNSSPNMVPGTEISRASSDSASFSLGYTDIFGNPLLLAVSAPRNLFKVGDKALNLTPLLLVAGMILFSFILYRVASRLILTPLESLSRDIGCASTDAAFDETVFNPEQYSTNREFVTLCEAINTMLGKVRRSETQLNVLQGILNGIAANIYVTDPETGALLFMNDRMLEEYGFAKQMITDKPCWEVLQRDRTSACDFCPIPKLLSVPGSMVEWEMNSPVTGRIYRNTGTLIRWVNGKQVHLVHATDITDITHATALLEERLEQQDLMSTISQSFIAPDDMVTLVSRALHLTGEFMGIGKILFARYDKEAGVLVPEYEWYSDMRLCPRQKQTIVPFRPGFTEYESFIVQKQPYAALNDISTLDEYAYARSHGLKSLLGASIQVFGECWGMLSFGECQAVREWSDSDIQLVRLLSGVISGVVERSLREQELLRMSSIVNSSPQYVAYVNAKGEFEYFNRSVEILSGYTAEELATGGLRLIFDDEAYKTAIETVIPAIIADRKYTFELPIRCKNGEMRLMTFSGFTTDGTSAGIGAIASDITKQRQMEQDILAARDTAERSNLAKSEFLSRMSHEMRTPMNAIIGMAGIGLAAPDPEKKQYCLSKIDEASTHLLGVINDILDMSKIEASKFELSPVEFSFEKMLLRVLNVTNFRLEEKNQQLNVSISPEVPYAIVQDKQRLAQVIANLLSNAVKFTPEEGRISITADLVAEANSLCTIRVAVKDSGIGISKEAQAKLFQSFEQADGSISRKYGGTGLGLVISKRIVEMMGGEIWIDSVEGNGATFAFTIKAVRGNDSRKDMLTPDGNRQGFKMLVVDESEDTREYFLNLSAELGLECVVANDGTMAVDLAQRPGNSSFNIMFVDWQTPGMTNIDQISQLKTTVGAESAALMGVPAVWNSIETEARAAGLKFIPKPLFSSHIVDCINECTGGISKSDIASNAKPLDENCFANCRILLAEDVEINREIVITLLEDTGITIDCAENGNEAVEMFKAQPEAYAAIFMDIHMPEVDGYEATRQIRNLAVPQAKTIPIIAMTANVFKEDIEHCLAAGMNDHIGKPVDIDELFAKLRVLCS